MGRKNSVNSLPGQLDMSGT